MNLGTPVAVEYNVTAAPPVLYNESDSVVGFGTIRNVYLLLIFVSNLMLLLLLLL